MCCRLISYSYTQYLLQVKESDLANGTLAVFFFLAHRSGAMNSCCRELLSPQTGIAALTLTVMQSFIAKKGCSAHIFPISIHSAPSVIPSIDSSGGSRTGVSYFAGRRYNHYTTLLTTINRQNVVFKPNVWKRQCLHLRGKKNTANVPLAKSLRLYGCLVTTGL